MLRVRSVFYSECVSEYGDLLSLRNANTSFLMKGAALMENSRQELENQELSTEELDQVSGG